MSPQTVNYVDQGTEVIRKLGVYEDFRGDAQRSEVDVSISWTTKTWYGKPVEG